MTSKIVEPVFPNPSPTDCVDGAMMYATVNYQPVKDAGYGGMSGYVGGNFGIGRRNIEAWWALGGWWMLNFERAADAYKGGATLGTSHANLALQQAAALGWLPSDCPVIFSATDTNIPAGDVATAHAYYRATVDVFTAAGAQGGAYGPPAYLRQLVAQAWWPQDWPLWQWAGAGQVEAWTWVKQVIYPTHAGYQSIPFTIDENHLYKPLRVWTGYGPDGPPDPPASNVSEEVVLVYNLEVYPQFQQAADAGYVPPPGGWPVGWLWWELVPSGGKRWLYGEEYVALYDWAKASGFKGTPDPNQPAVGRTTGQLQSIPDYMPSDQAAVLAAINGVQGSVTAVAGAVDNIPTHGTWGA